MVFGELNLFNSTLICFILKEKCAVPCWSQLMVVNCKLWNLSLTINLIHNIFWFLFRMALRPADEIEVILDSFLCTLHSTASAVTANTDVVRVNRFGLYLLTAVVPITTISHNLGLEIQDVNTTGPSVAVCQRIIGNMI